MEKSKKDDRDFLFEYLVIRAVTLLEIGLKICCKIHVKNFPERAEKLLDKINPDQNLTIQIISNYSFANLRDIEHVFSTLWGKRYLQVLRHRSEEYQRVIGYENERPYRAGHLYKNMGLFKKLMKLRNELVHENKPIKIKSKLVRKNLITTVFDVLYITHEEEWHFPYKKDEFDVLRIFN